MKAQIETDLENKLIIDTKGEKEDGMNWEPGIDIHTLLILWIKQITKEKGEPTVQHRELYSMLRGHLNGKEIQKGGDTCIHITDPLCCIIDTTM